MWWKVCAFLRPPNVMVAEARQERFTVLPVQVSVLLLLTLLGYFGCGVSASIFLLLPIIYYFPLEPCCEINNQLWKVTGGWGWGWIAHLLCTWAIDFESFIHQIVESSWISANWQLNFTFPEWSGNISAWIFFSNTGAGNKKLVGQCSYKNCREP